MQIIMCPIGIIHSPFTEKEQTLISASRSQAIGLVEVFPEFADGLKDIEDLSHIYLLYAFRESSGWRALGRHQTLRPGFRRTNRYA